jgi:uncharacterized membrane protein (UPF0127 family)
MRARKDKIIDFGDCALQVRVALTESERANGLMGAPSLGEDEGMLFVFEKTNFANFWMKNTLIPLDIAFVNESLQVVKISSMEPHVGRASSAPHLAKYVIEANKGWFKKHRIRVGSTVMIKEKSNLENIIESVVKEMWQNPTCFGDIIYRPFSEKFFEQIREMKERSNSLSESILRFDNFHREALETDIGEFGLFEGVHVPLDIPIPEEMHNIMFEAKKEKTKKQPELGVPRRGGEGKFYVYVRDPKTKNIKKIRFGIHGMSVGIHNAARRKSFAARHQCDKKNDRTKAGYWACRVPRYWKTLGLKKTSYKFW